MCLLKLLSIIILKSREIVTTYGGKRGGLPEAVGRCCPPWLREIYVSKWELFITRQIIKSKSVMVLISYNIKHFLFRIPLCFL